MPASAEDLFNYHARPGAFQRLLPPWERISLPSPVSPLQNHSQVTFDLRKGPLRIRWVAQNENVSPGHGFEDIQLRGPFKTWIHRHRFIGQGPEKSQLKDQIQVALPGAFLGNLMGQPMVSKQMKRLFWFRHFRTYHDLSRHAQSKTPRSVLLVGDYSDWCTPFASFMTTGGHRVFRLDREANGRIVMRPFLGGAPCHPLEQCDAIVMTERPSSDFALGESTIEKLDFLIRALKTLGRPPQKLIRIMSKESARKNWQDDPQIPPTKKQKPTEEPSPFETRLIQLQEILPLETRVYPGAMIHPNRNALTRLLLQLETFLFLRDQAQTPQFRWISREDFLGGLLFLIDHEEITGDLTLAHPAIATRAELQRLFIHHFYWHYALGRVFQVVGWATPGQNPSLNEYLRDFPDLQRWGFQCIAKDLKHAFKMEFGIPHSQPNHQMI